MTDNLYNLITKKIAIKAKKYNLISSNSDYYWYYNQFNKIDEDSQLDLVTSNNKNRIDLFTNEELINRIFDKIEYKPINIFITDLGLVEELCSKQILEEVNFLELWFKFLVKEEFELIKEFRSRLRHYLSNLGFHINNEIYGNNLDKWTYKICI